MTRSIVRWMLPAVPVMLGMPGPGLYLHGRSFGLARAYHVFQVNGYEIDIASPRGGEPPARGAVFAAGPGFVDTMAVDGRLVTGQHPCST
jgi:putative intracellular protease/amidase